MSELRNLPTADQSNIGQPAKEEPVEPGQSNWVAAERFKEAFDAADAIHAANTSHKEAVIHALCLTMRRIEDWRGEHQQEIRAYLGDHAPADCKDDVLPIVKCVFARHDKKTWNWHANAIRQAFSEKRTSDDAVAYFRATAPTNAAKKWTQDHRKPKPTEYFEVEISCVSTLPNGEPIPYPDKGKEAKFTVCIREDGKPIFRFPKPKDGDAKAKSSGRRRRKQLAPQAA